MRFLIVNPFGIGDVLFSTPLITSIKSTYPDAYIVYLSNARTRELLDNNPDIDRIFIYEKDEYRVLWKHSKWRMIKKLVKLLNDIRRERFDIAIDLTLGDRYSWILMLLGIGKRVGFSFKGRGRFLTQSLKIDGFEGKHAVEHFLDIGELIDCAPLTHSLTFNVSDSANQWADSFIKQNGLEGRHPLIAIIPGGGASWGGAASSKRWPVEGFIEVADALIKQRDAAIVLMGGGTDEAALSQQVKSAVSGEVIDVTNQTTLNQFAALLKRCDAVLCNDGGPVHIAVSQQARVVAIFGPVDDTAYGPYPRTDRTTVIAKSLPCRPCYVKFRMPPCPIDLKCLKDLKSRGVLNAVLQQLASNQE